MFSDRYWRSLASSNSTTGGTISIIDKDYHILLKDGVEEVQNIIFTDENDLSLSQAAWNLRKEERRKKATTPSESVIL